MTVSEPDDIDEDPRILEVSRDYLAALEAGIRPDQSIYLSRYPDLAVTLSECLDGIELAHSLRPAPLPSHGHSEFNASPLGDFQILHEIGRGGMGVVYEAIQLSLGRRIALKVLPFAAALDAKHLQRFKNESHAAAQLHHTNIVPVYAVGCERGVHFYAMQLINGRSLSAVIQELRGDEQTASNPWSMVTTADLPSQKTAVNSNVILSQQTGHTRESFRTTARIAVQVAEALEYAHEAGVVHRDIKPANLLLDAKGAIWVTDFGLAHVAADVGVTQTGDLVGTLRYMSPEQAAGRKIPIDHRTDVYSLGATLYELLTLQPIFSGQDRPTLLQQIFNDEPRPLHQLNRAIPRELETIVLKATAKSPSDRYASAGEMAADLRRFLEERPILARPPTVLDQVRKWIRRHPSFVRAALILLVCGTIGLAVSRGMIAHEQAETKAALQRESLRAAEAEERFQMARRVADEMIRLAEEELSDKNPFEEGLRKQLLETSLEYYQQFIDLKGESPNAQADLGVTRDRVKKILDDLAVLQADRNTFLLSETDVLADLGASEEQRASIKNLTLRRHNRRGQREHLGPNPDEYRQRLVAARERESQLAEILTPQQQKRLPQIALQIQGPRAFHDRDVIQVLKLTAQQRETMRRIEDEMLFNSDDEFPHMPPTRESFEVRLKEVLKQMLAVLNEDQLKTWRALTGKVYAGTFLGARPNKFDGPPGGPPRGRFPNP